MNRTRTDGGTETIAPAAVAPGRRQRRNGYWIFTVGYLLAIVGVLVYFFGASLVSGRTVLAVREPAIVFAAGGTALLLYGTALRLPLRRVGVAGATLGFAASLVAVAWFTTLYPARWNGGAGAGAEAIGLYVVGAALTVGVGVLVPIVRRIRGEDILVDAPDAADLEAETDAAESEATDVDDTEPEPEPDPEPEYPADDPSPVFEGRAHEGAVFALHDEDGEWVWRVVEQQAVVDAPEREAVEALLVSGPDAPLIAVEDAAFDRFEDDGGWGWRLVDADRWPLAHSREQYTSVEAAREAVEEVAGVVADADLLEFDTAAFQLYPSESEWRWRMIDADGSVIADSGDNYFSRDEAAEGMTTLKQFAPNAGLIEIDGAAFELYRQGGSFGWRLVDATGRTLADAATPSPTARAPVPR